MVGTLARECASTKRMRGFWSYMPPAGKYIDGYRCTTTDIGGYCQLLLVVVGYRWSLLDNDIQWFLMELASFFSSVLHWDPAVFNVFFWSRGTDQPPIQHCNPDTPLHWCELHCHLCGLNIHTGKKPGNASRGGDACADIPPISYICSIFTKVIPFFHDSSESFVDVHAWTLAPGASYSPVPVRINEPQCWPLSLADHH